MDNPIGILLLLVGAAALALSLSDGGSRMSGAAGGGPRVRTWTSSLSMAQAGIALGTVGQRTGYTLDQAPRPGLNVLADGAVAASYGQTFPVSLTSSGEGTVVRIGIAAKDPTRALTGQVQERRLDTLTRITRAIFVAAEEDAGHPRT